MAETSDSSSDVQSLLKWFESHGGQLHPSVGIHWFGQFGGYGFRAGKSIPLSVERPLSTEVVNCPYKVSLSYLNAVDTSSVFSSGASPKFPLQFLDLRDSDPLGAVRIGHFFLMQQFLLGEDSFWYPYIKMLPQPDQPQRLGTAVVWPEEDLEFLRGTNAEPAIQLRKELCIKGWQTGIAILKEGFENWQAYTFELYQWAAAVFGTRSFRPSLTLPSSWSETTSAGSDGFSILFPVLDIGNHMPSNTNVKWDPGSEQQCLGFCYEGAISIGDQIFNNYGSKSNSELLIGYGFMLPEDINEDTVNIKVKPTPEARIVRNMQKCQALSIPQQPLEEDMYRIHSTRIVRVDHRPEWLQFYSNGLIDLLAVMLGNDNEIKYMKTHLDLCPESSGEPFRGTLGRVMLHAMFILYEKLKSELARLTATGAGLGKPVNDNQNLGMEYRERQMKVLTNASIPLHTELENRLRYSSLHATSDFEPVGSQVGGELLSLEHAYDWLSSEYPPMFKVVEEIIATDQEEPKPLDWGVLVEEWDHTMWTFWLFTIYNLRSQVGTEDFRKKHQVLGRWMEVMLTRYYSEASLSITPFYGERAEKETIDGMIEQLRPSLTESKVQPSNSTMPERELLSFCSFVAMEECFRVKYPMVRGMSADTKVDQRALFICKVDKI
ncbi:set domain protein [Phlyctema vagabunda]|uniref:Set domain protein n=1 Tax=Phlyctema vagabunda TaxID=108571 RepID=A0ABR4PXQ6_9HELO